MSNWSVTGVREKPRKPNAIPMQPTNLKEWDATERYVFAELQKVFPGGLTAKEIAKKVGVSVQEMGDILYGDGNVSNLSEFVQPIERKQQSRVWRIRRAN
jgi:hypothetical protein